jgi:hypothetical protein
MAGKPKPPELRRDYTLRVRLAEDERVAIEQAAREMGLEVSTWARVQLLALAKGKRARTKGGTGKKVDQA